MSELFKNKYRVKSARCPNWDYGSDAAYFVTISTQNRECYFGEIVNMPELEGCEMKLSGIGEYAHKFWIEIPQRFPYTKLDEFVVMPNHVHRIVIIDKRDGGDNGDGRNAINRISTPAVQPTPATQNHGGITGKNNPMLSDNLSRIIRWYKGRVSYESHKIQSDFKWQSLFYDHIVRDDKSLQRIRDYIIENPMK